MGSPYSQCTSAALANLELARDEGNQGVGSVSDVLVGKGDSFGRIACTLPPCLSSDTDGLGADTSSLHLGGRRKFDHGLRGSGGCTALSLWAHTTDPYRGGVRYRSDTVPIGVIVLRRRNSDFLEEAHQ